MAARTGISSCGKVPYSSRPELGSYPRLFFQHEYEERRCFSKQISSLESAISNCSDAALLIYLLEKQLFLDDSISKLRPSLPALEKSLLELGTNTAVAEGVFYCICFKFKDDVIVRYFETGVCKGFMKASGSAILKGQHSLTELNMLSIFNEDDIKNLQNEGKSPIEKTYLRLLSQNKNSIKTQLELLKNSLTSGLKVASLLSLTVHCLRKNANPSSQNHRYLNVYPQTDDSIAQWDEALKGHIVSGAVPASPQLLDELATQSQQPMSLANQFSFISLLSNNHWAPYIKCDGKLSINAPSLSYFQYLLYQVEDPSRNSDEPRPLFYPTSLRHRLLYFHLQENTTYVKQLCSFYISKIASDFTGDGESDSGPADQGSSSGGPPTKKRKYTERVMKETDDTLGPLSRNLALNHTLYVDFRQQLITNGRISMRCRFQTSGVILMNDYNEENGHFMPLSYVHVTYDLSNENIRFQCSCSSYSHIMQAKDLDVEQATMTCMHCRFSTDFLVDFCKDPMAVQNCLGQQNIVAKLSETCDDLNSGVIVLSDRGCNGTIKMSVMSKDHVCAFVHLSGCRKYVTCQRGSCQASMRNKKKTLALLSLEDQRKICDHLQTLHSNQELWSEFLPLRVEDRPPAIGPDEPQEPDRNEETIEQVPGCFDTSTNLWSFGGLSQHKPMENMDPALVEHIRRRATYIDGILERKEHFLTGPTFQPRLPDTCVCGAGYVEDDRSLVVDYETRLFTRYGVVKVRVLKLECLRKCGSCQVKYSGQCDGIHQWSKDVCAGDEIGWDFVNSVLDSKNTFTGFVRRMSKLYRSADHDSPSFMSVPTFVSWFFSWMSSMKIDFRTSVDPWCKDAPKILAGDGTHVGVALKYLDKEICIERNELDYAETPVHKRYDRVFLPYDGRQDDVIRRCRSHLRWLCLQVLSLSADPLEHDEKENRNTELLSILQDAVCHNIIRGFLERSFQQDVLQKMAYILMNMCKDAPLIAFFPFRFHSDLLAALCELKLSQNISANLSTVANVAPEFADLLRLSLNEPSFLEIVDFVIYLIKFVQDVHKDDRPFAVAEPIPGSYNPEKGIAYYFTPHGCQVRKTPMYNIRGSAGNYDDRPQDDACTKIYPTVSRGGYSYMFLWFCPVHGHCYGFHLIPGAEGRKDPFSSMYKYLPNPPEEVFYDFGCSLSEYSLNRAPQYARNTRFWHDIFHGFTHKCPFVYRSDRLGTMDVNSEICEQFNAFIQCIKYTGSHLNQSHFCFFMQFFIKIWNDRKTLQYQKRQKIAAACAL